MVGKTKAPTKSEKRRLTILKENVPCLPCLLMGFTSRPSIQHTVSGMKRDGHMSTYTMCAWHHFGHPVENWQSVKSFTEATREWLGPSFAHGRKPFEQVFGSEKALVEAATMLVESFEDSEWLDYNVPRDVCRRIRQTVLDKML